MAIALLGASCASLATTVATVNGEKLDSSKVDEVATYMKSNTDPKAKIPSEPQVKAAVASKLVENMILVQEAKKLKLDKSDEYKKKLKAFKDELNKNKDKVKNISTGLKLVEEEALIAVFIEKTAKEIKVTDAEIKKEYDELSKYKGSNNYEVQIIEVKGKEDADKALKELGKGAKFEDVADKYSLSPAKGKYKAGQNDAINDKALAIVSESMADALKNIKKGEYNKKPIKVNDTNFAIIKVINMQPFDLPEFDKAKEALGNEIKQTKFSAKLKQIFDNAKVELPKEAQK